MLSARRKSDNQTVHAYWLSKSAEVYTCLDCNDPVILKKGKNRTNHFAHAYPLACANGVAETDSHRRCKMEIYEALQNAPGVQGVAMERRLGTIRPDISAYVRGVPVAIEVQISSLPLETIMRRTIEYHRQGIYVLWLLQWSPKLDADRYTPRLWEKWIHAAYFGRVYYWRRGSEVVSYHFEASFKSVPQTSWYSKTGRKMTGGGYSRKSKRHRRAVRGCTFDLKDFVPRERDWWEGGGLKVPDAKIFIADSHCR